MACFVAIPRVLLIVAGTLAAIGRANAEESAIFHKPVRLQADGVDIDTGDAWGHAGPCVADVDGDGLRDLVVGSFDGKFRFYKNIGSNVDPNYTAAGKLRAGDTDANVRIYCCIGSSPYFVDFDNDGKLDFISGSYEPGECYLFRGQGGGKFSDRETIVDKSGKPVLFHPDQQQETESFGSWPVMVDWNGDGKLDLLVGTFDGTLFVRLNEGTRERLEFSAVNTTVQAAGKELKLPGSELGHAAPAVTDWDRDGRWDILSGCVDGGVYFYRNVGDPQAPRFEEAKVLVSPHDGSGYEEVLNVGAEPVPGIRTQVFAVDYCGSGKTDLLVGDFCTTITPRPDLTAEERQEYQSLRTKEKEVSQERGKRFQAFRAEFVKRYPGNSMHSDEATAEWSKGYRVMRDAPEYEALVQRSKDLFAQMGEFLVQPPRKGRTYNECAAAHGYVWLFRRK